MLQLPGGSASQQVMLQVRFAEVNRAAITEAGVTFFANAQRFAGRSTTQQFAAPAFEQEDDNSRTIFNDFLNLFFFDKREGIGAIVKALESKGYFQSLAEPNLIAYNGQEASFLAGGEFPVPIVQGNTGSVSVTYKEFGVRLTFRPTIAGDVIRLKVKPEVSSLDFNNGVTIEGFRIPALLDASRRDRRRAPRRPVVRHRRSPEQHVAGGQGGDPDPEQAADHRRALQEQVGARRADRADGADHAAAGAAARPRRSTAAADAAEIVPAGPDRRRGRAPTPPPTPKPEGQP